MWTKFMETKTRVGAETWKKLLNWEAVAVQIRPVPGTDAGALSPHEIWIPDSKAHVAIEVLRKV
ncbi:MAG: hypothetical protein GEU28_02295 [Dehalococcoidia bacterium]|nr:hypothetical protein [Dehalococcoidia bacterium]